MNIPMTVWFGCEPDEFEVINQGRKRTAAQTLGIMSLSHAPIRAAVAQHMIEIQDRTTGTRDTNRIIHVALDHDNPTFAKACGVGQRGAKICNPSSLALAYYWIATRSLDARRIDQFFSGLIDGDGLGKGPILDLRDALRDKRKLGGEASGALTARRAGAMIIAWNGWVRRRRRVSLEWPHRISLPEVC